MFVSEGELTSARRRLRGTLSRRWLVAGVRGAGGRRFAVGRSVERAGAVRAARLAIACRCPGVLLHDGALRVVQNDGVGAAETEGQEMRARVREVRDEIKPVARENGATGERVAV